jgi:uncharacterized protein
MSTPYSLIEIERLPANCDDCGACCRDIGHPPFLVELIDGVPQAVDDRLDSTSDQQRILAAPAEARAEYLSSRHRSSGPCAWLDRASGRCRHYEFRPDICRTFEVAGKWCLMHRERVAQPCAAAGG